MINSWIDRHEMITTKYEGYSTTVEKKEIFSVTYNGSKEFTGKYTIIYTLSELDYALSNEYSCFALELINKVWKEFSGRREIKNKLKREIASQVFKLYSLNYPNLINESINERLLQSIFDTVFHYKTIGSQVDL